MDLRYDGGKGRSWRGGRDEWKYVNKALLYEILNRIKVILKNCVVLWLI